MILLTGVIICLMLVMLMILMLMVKKFDISLKWHLKQWSSEHYDDFASLMKHLTLTKMMMIHWTIGPWQCLGWASPYRILARDSCTRFCTLQSFTHIVFTEMRHNTSLKLRYKQLLTHSETTRCALLLFPELNYFLHWHINIWWWTDCTARIVLYGVVL